MDTFAQSWNAAELNYRNPQPLGDDSRIFSRPQGTASQVGSRPAAPPVPPRPYGGGVSNYGSTGYGMNSYGSGGMFGGYSGYGGGFGGFGGLSGFGGGYGMMGGGYGSRFGGGYGYGHNTMGGGDVENRFIQIAEESSRSTFQSIESVVSAVLNIAAMLDSTYFALTSSFRAVLGVAANFGRLRGLFSQFWQSFALLRGLNWLYKKILYMLRISNIDPGSKVLAEAFAAAEGGTDIPTAKNNSSIAVLAFLAFISIGPYLLMKLIGTVSKTAIEESRNPKTWTNPINAVVQYDFIASSPMELTARAGQNIVVAPKHVQSVQKLLDSGWVLATIDGKTTGLIPVNYIESVRQTQAKELTTIPEEKEPEKTVVSGQQQGAIVESGASTSGATRSTDIVED